jgi:branched-chain amino acid aminotransferase
MGETADPGFGNFFTPHMVISRWSREVGWMPFQVTAHDSLGLPPSALALHYGQAVFEGLKAYSREGGKAASLFRPDRCAARFARSAARLCMPAVPEDYFIAACERLVQADLEYVPAVPGQSLYLRPYMIATEATLAVRAAEEYLFCVIASPSGSFFSSVAADGISAWCSDEHVRAVSGGTGMAKFAGNYAASLIARVDAVRHGCQEVLWLDAAERRWVEELSAMNFFCVMGNASGRGELVTPPLGGTILDGNTRDSILRLAGRRGTVRVERPVALAEIVGPDTRVVEAFACGTAATVLSVTRIVTKDGSYQIGDGKPGEVAMAMRDELIAIQEGRVLDEFGWMHDVRQGQERSEMSASTDGA